MPAPASVPLVRVEGLSYTYGERRALDNVSFEVGRGEIVGFLGPNGSGKSTLFHLLSTLYPPQSGTIAVAGFDAARQSSEVRARIGVVFQRPSLDPKLTVAENIRHQGHLYGFMGADLRGRVERALADFRLADRAHDLAETLSGGLKRRVEIAKSLLHAPDLLLLDEPSVGLDPAAVGDLWRALVDLRRERSMTVMVTTHHMDEAEQCDRLALVDSGRIVAFDSPSALKSRIAGQTVSIRCAAPEALRERLNGLAGADGAIVAHGLLQLQTEDGPAIVAELMRRHGVDIDEVTVGKASLRDVFLKLTGHLFDGGESA